LKPKTIFTGVFVLIVIYLFATRANQIAPMITGLAGESMKAVALLQGRENVVGVTV
jgi:hypothetical protein